QCSLQRFTVLLNQVWGLKVCPSKGQTMRTNRRVRSDFCWLTVLSGSSGFEVSRYTTVGGDCVLWKRRIAKI
ncbi:MAG: hypothetical protein RIS63_1093, partial [Bacteroidota bacterium]